MKPQLSFKLAALLLAIPLGCGGSSLPQPVEPPARTEEPRTEVRPEAQQGPPELVAPPPAYGNKVVTARRHADGGDL
jgi:hypothetical protein